MLLLLPVAAVAELELVRLKERCPPFSYHTTKNSPARCQTEG